MPAPLMNVCALQAFGKLSKAHLLWVGRHYGMELDAQAQSFKKKTEAMSDESRSLSAALRAKKKDINPVVPKPPPPKKRCSQKVSSGPIAPPVIDDSMDEAKLTSLMPVGFRVWRDKYNARWKLFQGRDRVKNIAWNKHTYVGASRQVIVEAWHRHAAAGCDEAPEWLAGMEAESGVSASSGEGGAGAASSSC